MFKKILVATDGSDHAGKAVEIASVLAATYDAELVVLTVKRYGPVTEGLRQLAETEHLVDDEGASPPAPLVEAPPWMIEMMRTQRAVKHDHEIIEAMARRILEEAEQTARDHGVAKVHTATAAGDPATEILACAEREKADVIVLGSRGLSEIKGLLLGSVSHKVAQLARVTCITVK